MKLIPPSVEFWPQPEDWHDQVARAARLCYATDGESQDSSGSSTHKRTSAELCDLLVSRGHNSMFRHGSAYFYLSFKGKERMSSLLYARLVSSPFVCVLYSAKKNNNGILVHHYYISTNMQYIMDNPDVYRQLREHELSPAAFASIALDNGYKKALNLLRYTVCVTTQIGTSRELNRTSPNSIAEQSTRYVNFGKRGGVAFVTPYWWQNLGWLKRSLAKLGWRTSEFFYNLWLCLGFPAEAARSFLMLETGTRVAYTYNVYEWRHIMALRLTGATGRPHPDAKITAQQIYNVLVPVMRNLDANADLVSMSNKPKKA